MYTMSDVPEYKEIPGSVHERGNKALCQIFSGPVGLRSFFERHIVVL